MSKRMTKVLSMILTLVMFLSVSTPAFAWGNIGIGEGWDRDIGEDEVRDFDVDVEEEKEEYDYFSTFDEETGINVTVEAPMGALPTLAEVRVEPVDPEAVREAVDSVTEGEREILLAMDISFWLEDDEIEPEEPVRVRIAAPELEGRSDLTVVHIPDEEEPESIDLITDENDLKFELGTNEICFESGDFSVYAVVGGGETDPEARITVNFYNPVSGTPDVPVATVYVKNADELLGDGVRQDYHTYIDDIVYDPGVGETLGSGQMFRGWSLDVSGVANVKDNGHVFVGANYHNDTVGMTIPEIRVFLDQLEITEGDVLNVYAMIYNVYHITYQDAEGITLASDVVLMSIHDSVADYEITQTYTTTEQTENFEGWHVIKGATVISEASAAEPYPMGTTMKISGDVIFSTKISQGHWLVYEENGYGATYNAPVFIKANEKAKAPALEMLRPGYTFDGWYTGAPASEGADPTGEKYEFDANGEGGLLTDRLTLYAKWIVSPTAKYTVIVWKQSVVDDKDATDAQKTYDFAFSVEVNDIPSNKAVSALDLSEYTGLDGGSKTVDGKTYSFYGFKYNADQMKSNYDTVQPNGTTVINLYYDRELVTYRFTAYGLEQIPNSDIPSNFNSTSPVYFIYFNGEYCPVRYYDSTYTDIYKPTTSNSGTQYGVVDGVWTSLEYKYFSGYGYLWVYLSSDTYYQYDGTRYYHSDSIGGTQYYFRTRNRTQYAPYYTYQWKEIEAYTMTGLYGQKLTKYDYTWPTDYRWINDIGGSTFTSIQDIFESSVNENPSSDFESTFYGEVTQYNTNVYHYLQNVDGSYNANPTYTIPTVVGNGMVFRNFQGFTASEFRIALPSGVSSYTTGTSYNGDNLVNPVSHTSNNGWTEWLPYGTGVEYDGNTRHELTRWIVTAGGIEFRYSRNQYDLTYMVGRFVDRNGAALTPPITGQLKKVEDIAYESSLASYAQGGENWFEPAAQTGFVFAGWYIDETCTTPVDFANTTMPMNGMTLYAKWQQTEYRVFLHSNAYTVNGDGTYDRDTTLNWGSDTQAMNFRIAHGNKVSIPTGLRTGYEFGGWYTDPEFTNPYNVGTRLTDNTVPETPAYDKTADWTDGANDVEMDKWGLIPDNATPINKDVDRFWITRKLDLYARWSKIIVGADGIGIFYDANGGTSAPSDTLLYKDNVRAVAQAASKSSDPTKEFAYWVLQKWNGTAYEDIPDAKYYPGEAFPVLLDYARQVENEGSTDQNPSYTYTIQLRAEYVNKDAPLPTHITWYANNGETGTVVEDGQQVEKPDQMASAEVKINENIQIPIPSTEINRDGTASSYIAWDGISGKDLVWEGHVFLGWARLASDDTTDKSLLSEEDLFLRYDPATKSYFAKVEEDDSQTTEQSQYYLVGYFDDADYDGREYPFVNGKVIASFNQDSYVAIADKNGDWFMTDEYVDGTKNSGVFKKQTGEKMFVPAKTLLTFTLVENSDGSLTLSYSTGMNAMAVSAAAPLGESNGTATVTINGVKWTKVDYVAADEFAPYHDMYAVWAKVFYIYHSGTGVVEKVTVNNATFTETETNGTSTTSRSATSVDIANRTSDGFLYGGYYASYAGVGSGFDVASAQWLTPAAGTTDTYNDADFTALINKGWYSTTTDTTATKYDGANATWSKDTATTDLISASGNGLQITPQAGAVYYIKEVPADKYLQPYFHYTYKKGIEGEPIVTAWLISDIDDQNYTESGFVIVDANGKAKICSSLTVQNAVGGNTIKLTAKRIFGVDGSGLLTYRRVIENYAGINGFGDGAKILQYWVTPDGLIVTGTTSRVYTGTAGKTGISCTPTPEKSTIALFGNDSLAVPPENVY